MVSLTKIVDADIANKLDLDALGQLLPETEKDVNITLVATKKERKADKWEKGGKIYYRIILDYNKVLSSSKESILKSMKDRILETVFP